MGNKNKPELTLLKCDQEMKLGDVFALFRSLTGREPTEEDIRETTEEWNRQNAEREVLLP
jgi:hypothetical protein